MPDRVDNNLNVSYIGQPLKLELTVDFAVWLGKLRDRDGQIRIRKRLVRLANGHFGDCKPIGSDVHELRMFFGPGYRVYFMKCGDTVILLLAGGDKNSQVRDIIRAKALAEEFIRGNKNDPI